jgi:hypothetical protein
MPDSPGFKAGVFGAGHNATEKPGPALTRTGLAGAAELLQILFADIKPMRHPMRQRGKNNPHDGDEYQPAKKRVSDRKYFCPPPVATSE